MLSEKEMELVMNADVILTKNTIMKKAWLLLEQLQDEIVAWMRDHPSNIPEPVIMPPAKISKGENYQGLPYLVLDYPRYFQKDDVFAIRTIFWWGNFFSVTLHLSGRNKIFYSDKLKDAFDEVSEAGYFICVSSGEWEHDFAETNYQEVQKLGRDTYEDIISSNTFIKIATMVPLSQWETANEQLYRHFRSLVSYIN
jgi:hypothetical protein